MHKLVKQISAISLIIGAFGATDAIAVVSSARIGRVTPNKVVNKNTNTNSGSNSSSSNSLSYNNTQLTQLQKRMEEMEADLADAKSELADAKSENADLKAAIKDLREDVKADALTEKEVEVLVEQKLDTKNFVTGTTLADSLAKNTLTEKEVADLVEQKLDTKNVVTETTLAQKGYATTDDIDRSAWAALLNTQNYATKSDLSAIVSDTTLVDTKIDNAKLQIANELKDYAKTSELDSKVQVLGYAKTADVESKIATAKPDLTAVNSEIATLKNTVATNKSDLEEQIKNIDVSDKLKDYAKMADVNAAVANKADSSRVTALETGLDDTISKKIDTDYIANAVDNKLKALDIDDAIDTRLAEKNYVEASELEKYAPKADLTKDMLAETLNGVFVTGAELEGVVPSENDIKKIVVANSLTEANVNNIVANKLTGYATTADVSAQIAAAQLEGQEVDLSAYALKTELPTVRTDAEIKTLAQGEIGKIDWTSRLSSYAKTTDLPTVRTDDEIKTLAQGEIGKIDWTSRLSSYAKTTDVPTADSIVAGITKKQLTDKLGDAYAPSSAFSEYTKTADLTTALGKSFVLTSSLEDTLKPYELIANRGTNLANAGLGTYKDGKFEARAIPDETAIKGYISKEYLTGKLSGTYTTPADLTTGLASKLGSSEVSSAITSALFNKGLTNSSGNRVVPTAAELNGATKNSDGKITTINIGGQSMSISSSSSSPDASLELDENP